MQQKANTRACSQVTACFTSAYFANYLPARSYIRGPKRWTWLGVYIKTVHSVDHVLPKCPNQSQVRLATRGPVISISLDPLTTTWLKSDLRQTSTCSKLSPPGYRHLTIISSILGYMPGCHSSDKWRSNAYHLLTMHHVHIGVIIKFAALFFETPCMQLHYEVFKLLHLIKPLWYYRKTLISKYFLISTHTFCFFLIMSNYIVGLTFKISLHFQILTLLRLKVVM